MGGGIGLERGMSVDPDRLGRLLLTSATHNAHPGRRTLPEWTSNGGVAPHESILPPRPGSRRRRQQPARSSVLFRAYTRGRSQAMPPNPWRTPLAPFRIAPTFLLGLIASVLFLPQLAHAATPPGLVAAYSFDEKNGSTVADASGNGNTGTISNATWTSTAKHGSALTFNGSSSMVTIQPSASLALTTGTTFEAWVRPTGTNSRWRSVMFKDQPQELLYALYANSDRGPSGRDRIHGRRRADGVRLELGPDIDVDASRRHPRRHERASLRQRHARLDRRHPGTKPSVNGALRIGGNGVWKEWFKGQIDDVRVYDRALTAAEIGSDLADSGRRTPRSSGNETRSAPPRPRISPRAVRPRTQ